MYAKCSKCSFGCQELEYLGHIISEEGVKVDPIKIKDMQTWSLPKLLKGRWVFLGLISYYHKCVKDYGKIVAPLTALLKNNAFNWLVVFKEAFHQLKDPMWSNLVLAMPKFYKTFIIESDTFDIGLGVVLKQKEWPLAFTSKALSN